MKPELNYIELKSGFGNNGPAWIGEVAFSKSGRTIYFNGKALKNTKAMGIEGGNHYDIETGEEYWVSGIKKNGQDRHYLGSGKIMIDRKIVNKYLKIVDLNILNQKDFELVEIQPTDKQKSAKLENEKLN